MIEQFYIFLYNISILQSPPIIRNFYIRVNVKKMLLFHQTNQQLCPIDLSHFLGLFLLTEKYHPQDYDCPKQYKQYLRLLNLVQV